MTTEEKAKAYDEAIETARKELKQDLHESGRWAIQRIFPNLKESEDERIRKVIYQLMLGMREEIFTSQDEIVTKEKVLAYLEKQKEEEGYEAIPVKSTLEYKLGFADGRDYEKQKEQKPIKMEVYEVGKGTTICGQDYKCKKDYKEGNCWYIKDVVYHCSRDGYLTDQNGISWSCTPEWFKEYIQSNTEWAEEEKTHFVSGQFLQCKLSFDGFKEGEHYWLEYVGNDMYVGRSDNILNQKFHITPRQLFTLFSQELEEVQGPPQEEKQVSLNYEPPFDENPSDKEIVEALIKHLKEQDGFLTAIDSVSTKAILSWLEKQKEQKPAEWSEEDERMLKSIIADYEKANEDCFKLQKSIPFGAKISWLKSLRSSWKPSEWNREDRNRHTYLCDLLRETWDKVDKGSCIDDAISWLEELPTRVSLSSWKPSEEQMKGLKFFLDFHRLQRNAGTTNWREYDAIESLYKQLKKL